MAYYKKLIIFIFIVIFLFISCTYSYGASTIDYDAYDTLYSRQYNAQGALINFLMSKADNPQTTSIVRRLYERFQNLGKWGYSIWVGEYTIQTSSNIQFQVSYAYLNDLTMTYGNITHDGVIYTNQLYYSGSYYNYLNIYNDYTYATPNTLISNATLAQASVSCIHPQWYELFKQFGMFIDNADSQIIQLLQSLGQQSQNQYTSILNNINNNIQEQTDAINEQTNTINDMNDFIQDDDFDDSNLDLPSDNTQDITQDGISNIFTQIYNGFTSGEPSSIVLNIPFTNKSITISSTLTYDILNGSGFGVLKTLIEAFWWYIISRFIVKDISKKISMIKSGNFENIQNNNIKEDML